MRMLSSTATPAAGWQPAVAAARRCARVAASAVRRHWLLTLLLAAGLVLRAAAQVAYRPALFYIDSIKYLLGAYPGNDPPGYQVLLKPLLAIGGPFGVAAVQHLLGLGLAVALYLLLLRRGAPRWLGALAAAPVLLDAYQLQMEQSIMPDVWFEAVLVTGLVALLWQPRPARWMLITGGLALGASAAFRQVGEILVLPALLYAIFTTVGWRQRLGQAALLCAAFAVPIVGASFVNFVSIGHFSLAPYAASTIYGRVAEVADCRQLVLPSYERPLCPTPREKLLGPDGLDHDAGSPIKTYVPPIGMRNHNLMVDFAKHVVVQQPVSVVTAVGRDAVKLFAVARATTPGDTPIARWQFQDSYPQYPPYVTIRGGQVAFASLTPPLGTVKVLGTAQRFGGGPPVAVAPLASFLRAYQLGGGYTPGPLFAFAVLAGLAGSASLLLRQRLRPAAREAALACLLVFGSAVILLLASDAFEYSWRYQLPAVVTLPPAGALAIAVLLAQRAKARSAQADAAAGGPAAGPGRQRPEPSQRDRAPAS